MRSLLKKFHEFDREEAYGEGKNGEDWMELCHEMAEQFIKLVGDV